MKSIMLFSLTILVLSANVSARDLTGKEKQVVIKAVKERLKDPDSAKFKFGDYKGDFVYCAQVNAKNSYGGYTGFVPFQVGMLEKTGPIKNVFLFGIGDAAQESAISISCSREGYDFQ
ncbi:hypothetical protein [Laribacter hongkongensis]|uniref:Secreted protein n=1 Tax=Laribacter hongkongensis TaxID=168471 RepID=A0ABD4SV64_9NEIS|nr:hypothetical protein [Laribacter hongkongensis]MCG9027337.1 hypothetical protein [Laribacter hongkongensis]